MTKLVVASGKELEVGSIHHFMDSDHQGQPRQQSFIVVAGSTREAYKECLIGFGWEGPWVKKMLDDPNFPYFFHYYYEIQTD